MRSPIIVTTRGKPRVSVDLRAIESMFQPGGDVWGTARDWSQKTLTQAVLTTPHRTGNLASSFARPAITPQGLSCMYTVRNDADYALYVHEGTTGPIRANNATGYLWVRPFPHSRFDFNQRYAKYGGRTPLISVDGQSANPWMRDAMEAVLRAERAAL